jgi:ABC-2 type transport system ATP-binding protein
MIRVQDLSKQYGKNVALNNISATFLPGNVYGIVGVNGAGKSTLFRCIAGLELFKGTISSDKEPLKNHLGLLMPEPYFFSRITGKEYINLLCSARNIHIDDIEGRNVFDLPLAHDVTTYSTGMKKKLAIIAILLQQNEYYILDEPFNGLDIQSAILLTEIILKLKQAGKIVLVSSHIFATLNSICDIIFTMEDGSFTNVVEKCNFQTLEDEMKRQVIGNKLDKLGIF